DVHTSYFVNLIIFNFREDQLLFDTKSIVASAVKCVWINAPEVTYTRKRQVDKTVSKLIHLFAAQSYLASNGHAFPDLEVSHGFLSLCQYCMLSGDDLQISYSRIKN